VYIDIGNSFIKIAQFADGEWQILLRARHDQIDDVMALLGPLVENEHPIMGCSVVKHLGEKLETRFGKAVKFVTVDDFHNKRIDYDTPETLGTDRFLACLGAHGLSGYHPVVVIDAGTATTIDFMDSKGVFKGGVIAPGLSIFEQGLHQHAPALPKVKRNVPPDYPPKSTEDALRWGIVGSYLSMIRSHIDRFREVDPDSQVWITGGDAEVLSQMRDIRMQYHPNLVFEGLRAWEKAKLK
jgi:type III pantothenate kinase